MRFFSILIDLSKRVDDLPLIVSTSSLTGPERTLHTGELRLAIHPRKHSSALTAPGLCHFVLLSMEFALSVQKKEVAWFLSHVKNYVSLRISGLLRVGSMLELRMGVVGGVFFCWFSTVKSMILFFEVLPLWALSPINRRIRLSWSILRTSFSYMHLWFWFSCYNSALPHDHVCTTLSPWTRRSVSRAFQEQLEGFSIITITFFFLARTWFSVLLRAEIYTCREFACISLPSRPSWPSSKNHDHHSFLHRNNPLLKRRGIFWWRSHQCPFKRTTISYSWRSLF